MLIKKGHMIVFVALFVVVDMCVGQSFVPQLSVGSQLEALTPPVAFSSRSSAVTVQQIALGAQQFGLELLQRVSSEAEKASRDFMISPFSVWSLLILLYEGSGGQTYQQLRQALHIDVEDETLRSVYRRWSAYLNVNTSTIEVASLQALYTDKSSPLHTEYREALQSYNVEPVATDFFDRSTAAQINEATNRSTRGLIPYAVLPQEIYGSKIFMLSSLYFKGQWKYPFSESGTHEEPFYNERGDVVTRIPMMVQKANFAYVTNVEGLEGYVLELPYGAQDRLSMIIVLPKRGHKLNEIVTNLRNLGMTPLLERLAKFRKEATEDNEVEVLMPKFTTTTDVSLKQTLTEMGIRDLFNDQRANLSRMANGLFASLCVHSTKIIVDEKGTTAGANTAASLNNKSSPPKFELNRPFQYMIVERSTGLLLFAGQVWNPKTT